MKLFGAEFEMGSMQDLILSMIFVVLAFLSLNIVYRVVRRGMGGRFGGRLAVFPFLLLVVASVVCGNIAKRMMT